MKLVNIIITFAFLLAFVLSVSAQSNPYSNELKGYEFFGNGKLKNLQLTVSSKNDVKKIFGGKCKKKCDYDTDWSISFEYYENIWIKTDRNDKDEKLTYFLDSKYLGKLRSIVLIPKKRVSFLDVSFPDTFQKLIETSNMETRSEGRSVEYKMFRDAHGLAYQIYEQKNYDDFNEKKTKSYKKDDLVFIRYEIPKEREKELFVLQK